MSDHCGYIVLSPCVRIGEIVLKLPESTLVVLDAAFVGVACPVTKIESRFETLGLAPSKIEAKLHTPYQIFQRVPIDKRSNVRKDISCQFLPVEENVIFKSDSDRVWIQIMFVYNRSIISVKVIDRNVRT